MSNGWAAQDVTKSPGQIVSGVQSNVAVSLEGWRISAGGANTGLVVKIKVAAATVVGSITAKLQTAIGGDYVDSKTVTITAAGNFYIKLLGVNSSDWTYLPLLNKGQVVVSNTNAGDTVTITSVEVLQEL